MRLEDELKMKQFSHPFQKAMLNIGFTGNWIRQKIRPTMEGFGLTAQQYNVLRILRGRHPEAAFPGEVKAVMIDKTPDLTRLIDRLLKKELVTRNTCAENRRKVALHITKKGLLLLEEMEPVLKAKMKDLQKITDEEAEMLSALLDKLRA
ncbi:MAG: MarR family winged helix-turn-helix transcriptional regulator [Salibacteraceae bacterium]